MSGHAIIKAVEEEFKRAFRELNAQQRKAATTIDGPLLVIAGPGTGKTQLISTRVGYILSQTDTPPETVLCLTFTEAGATAMRERLTKLLGQAAYDISLSTYHAFGSEILRRYPEYFEEAELSLVDELGSDVMLRGIIARLPYSSPMKFADSYLSDIKSFISDAKRALLSPADINKIAALNLEFVVNADKASMETLQRLNSVVSKKDVPTFTRLLRVLQKIPGAKLPDNVAALGSCAAGELTDALADYDLSGKTTQLSRWKRNWLSKDRDGNYIFEGRRQNERLAAAADIYDKYQRDLKAEHLYDYDDMILRVIDVLQKNPEFKYTVAEQYNYIMLDEFQDTNPAQMRLVELLTDHSVHEGRPNVMAVGDDDQAIYAFQGATHANMAAFTRHYRDVAVISLKENYRAHQELLEVGANIAAQIGDRLHEQFEGVQKSLEAVNKKLPEPPKIEYREFTSDAAHYQWIADEIAKLVKAGIPPRDIAVLAPKHRNIQPLIPYLVRHKLPIRYERRENILDEPLLHQLEQMCRLVVALSDGNDSSANALWPEILSYDFWNLPVNKIWQAGWAVRSSREPWTGALLNDRLFAPIADFFLKLASLLPLTTLEQLMDGLIGVPGSVQELKLPQSSPLFEYYFGTDKPLADAQSYVHLISDLNILRDRLRDWRRRRSTPSSLRDLVEFIEGYRAAGINILNTSPYHEAADAVNLLTAYGSKGREFQAVFIAAAVDEVWGSKSRNQGYRLSLPANLSFIRYQGASEDERLRLLFVAATRARTRLYFASYKNTLAGRGLNRLKYLDVTENENGEIISRVLPDKFSTVVQDTSEGLSLDTARSYWTDRHTPPFRPDLKTVLTPQLERYQLSATHLNHFLDIVDSGPQTFFLQCVLGFSGAPNLRTAYGTAIHGSLRWAGTILTREGNLPTEKRLVELFAVQLGNFDLASQDYDSLLQRGKSSLHSWLTGSGKQLKTTDKFEYDFAGEGVSVNEARLSGKIDRLMVDEKTKTITVLDYKTGQSYRRWQGGVIKLHKFRQQLMMYKLLVEGSNRFKGYKVDKGYIEFIEPDEDGQINRLELLFDEKETGELKKLIGIVWQHIQHLDLPDTSKYPPTLSGIKAFEEDLLKQK